MNNVNLFLIDDYNNTNTDVDFVLDTDFEINMDNNIASNYFNDNNFFMDLSYLKIKHDYNNDRIFYDELCTLKELWKICDYYGISKGLKSAKCKKADIIDSIILFESLPQNYEIVYKRNKMWAYLKELLSDPNMSKYILWT
jgi:hypothetical protein